MVERVKLNLPAKKNGRPSGCTPDVIRATKKACKLGAIDMDLAEMFGVSKTTITNWKHSNEEFFWALTAGKDEANHEIEQSLFKSAKGFYIEEEEIKVITIARDRQEAKPVKVCRYIPPNVTAQIFFLKNRMPEQYRDKHEIGGTVEVQAELATAKDRFFDKLAEYFARLDARRGVTQIEGDVVSEGRDGSGVSLARRLGER